MGLEIDRERFRPEEFRRFEARLERSLVALERLLARPGFGVGPGSIGAELEVTLIDAAGRPLPRNEGVLGETVDERLTVELDRFNLECNLRHAPLAGGPFGHLRGELESARAELARAAALHGGRVVAIGILPTLVEAELQSGMMTDAVRYRALSRSLRTRRGGPFELDIDGEDPLVMVCEDVTFEGAATSFQLHLRVDPAHFADVYDAAQLATAPVLAGAANSPTFLGHRLWEETRVALFEQAVDARTNPEDRPARVAFGRNWLEEGPLALFRRSVRDYPVLLPIVDEEDPDRALAADRVPRLRELRLHQGTVWHWNRPVYDPHDGGHLRIELRALPSGPSVDDMVANAAFLIGLTLGLAPRMARLRPHFDFAAVHANFYRAAREGLGARLLWPEDAGGTKGEQTARALIPTLGGIARAGLRSGGVDPADAGPPIDRFLERAERGTSGARWQRERLGAEGGTRPDRRALAGMLEEYVAYCEAGLPVAHWGRA